MSGFPDEGCMPEPELDAEDLEFIERGPRGRFQTSRNPPPPAYTPIVRADEPSESLSEDGIYSQWKESGKVFTIRTGRNAQEWREMHILVRAYIGTFSSAINVDAADFRDAIVDAIAEFLDDHGVHSFWFSKEVTRIPPSPLKRLIAFYSALVVPPSLREEHYENLVKNQRDKQQAKNLREEIDNLPESGNNREIWELTMRDGRCKFHEHVSGQCWRAEDGRKGGRDFIQDIESNGDTRSRL